MKQKLGYLIPTETDVQLELEFIPHCLGLNTCSSIRLALENKACDIKDIENDNHIAVAYFNKQQVLSLVRKILKFLKSKKLKKGFNINTLTGKLFVSLSVVNETKEKQLFIMLNEGVCNEQWTSLTKDEAILLSSFLLKIALELDDF